VPAGVRFLFERFELDPSRRRLTCAGEPIALSDRQLDVLLLLVARAGQIVPKDDLLQAGWKDVAVGDNSVEQAISSLRRVLGVRTDGAAYIETAARRGYRFGAPVQRAAARESDAGLDALLAPHRAYVEGRAALETLEAGRIARARQVFADAVRDAPDHAPAHVGLANACLMQFEMTRADPEPDGASLSLAVQHARDACRLDPHLGEAWATLGFVLERTGGRIDARAAAGRAVALEPDNWRHHFRLASVSWGEARLRAAQRTLDLLPGFPLAHWLAATVHVARQALDEAERELTAGVAAAREQHGASSRFVPVALHWLLGLLRLARGDEQGAIEALERELAEEASGQLYSRECCANAWYGLGAVRLRQRRPDEARAAFARALERIERHPAARVALAFAAGSKLEPPPAVPAQLAFEAALARAVGFALEGRHGEAARIVDEALTSDAADNAGWFLPVEPLLQAGARPDAWANLLARLRNRAA
jgi:DNA-binding winged helix-turn-helix (wHTH) protein